MDVMLGFKKCAPCINNFIEMFCHLTCNPNQNKYFKVLIKLPADEDVAPGKEKLGSVSYPMTLENANLFFNSCSLTSSAGMNGEKFFTIFQDPNNGTRLLYQISANSPFKIDFHIFNKERTFHLIEKEIKNITYFVEEDIPRTTELLDLEFTNCNETSRGQSCRCSQCQFLDCDHIPGVVEPSTCIVFGLISCSSLVILIIYVLLLILSVVFFVGYLRRRNKRNIGKVLRFFKVIF